MKNMLRRNMKLHFGTPASVLFSMVGVLITFFVCAVFLEDSLINQVMDRAPGMDRSLCKWLIECWIMAGLLSMTPVTASAGVFAIMINDGEKKIIKDFKSSPLKKYDYPMAMVLCAAIAGFLISLFMIGLYTLYISMVTGHMFAASQLIYAALVALLTSVVGCCVHGFLLTFVKTMGGFSNYSTFLGTTLGFFNAIYLPMGAMPGFLQDFVKILPFPHAGPILRNILMAEPMNQIFAGADAATLANFRKYFGVDFYLFEKTQISYAVSLIFMAVFAAVCFIFFMIRYNAKREQF